MAWPQFEVGLVLALSMSFVFTLFTVLKRDACSFCVFANNHAWVLLDFPVLFLPIFACICCLSCLVGAGVHGGVPRDCSAIEEEFGWGGRWQHHLDQPEKRLWRSTCMYTYLPPPTADACHYLTICTIFICYIFLILQVRVKFCVPLYSFCFLTPCLCRSTMWSHRRQQ